MNSPKHDGQDISLQRRSSLICVSSRILFVLGFHLPWDSMVAKCVSQVFPIMVSGCQVGARSVLVASIYAGSVHNRPCTSWARPLSAHECGIIRPISWRSINLEFYPLQLPPHPMGLSSLNGRSCGVTVPGSWVDGSKACGLTVQSSWVDGFSADAVNCANI